MNRLRYIRIAVIVLIIELVCSVCAFAESTYRVGDDVFYYEYNDEGRLAIVGIDSDSDTVNIPKEIYGNNVEELTNGRKITKDNQSGGDCFPSGGRKIDRRRAGGC